MTILRLDLETVGKIAAGEVIERPAAAIKELVENAIDASATRIDVSIAGGGVDVIDVRDNGYGMTIDQLPLAVERHATSKITSLDDLGSLATLGFRGEALASLAAVSDLRLISTVEGAPSGGELRSRYGTVSQSHPMAWARGTMVQARDLFSNVPARRKFLKQPQTESGYVTRVVGAYALAYPTISFSLDIDDRTIFSTSGSGNALDAAICVWGAEVAGSLVPLSTPDETAAGYSISGIVSLPELDRATRQQQYLFAQGRLIADRRLAAALEQAYHTLLMIGRRPIACIQLSVPTDRIDVNVHPTKAEVRFADDRLIFGLVQRSVREAISRHASFDVKSVIVSSPIIDQSVQRRMALAHPEWLDRRTAERLHERQQDGLDAVAVTPHDARRLPVLRVLGQIASMFVVAEGPDGMYLVDQHAAHERVLFERLMIGVTSQSADKQLLLHPATVDLPLRHWETFLKSRNDLAALGFDIDEFGATTVVIRSVPAALKIKDPHHTLLMILDELAAGGRGETRLESAAISAACHTSIRAGQLLTLLEMRELVRQLEACSSPLACGHGRPTMLRMTAQDLERQFSRR
ncbi:MAG TPA: DNA mismatch repair endonuclease MutL [Thermomicrobiales bacterium]|nr:DNA mismatch repair endonuclease MutL [Thermomicrobiales bacterium]